jgi:integrase
MGNLFKLLLGTGLRPEEAYGLTWQKVDLDKRVIMISQVVVTVNGKQEIKLAPKTEGSHRTIEISPSLVACLKNQRVNQNALRLKIGSLYRNNNLVFANATGLPLNPSNVNNRHFKKLLEKAGLPDMRLYDLRYPHLNKIRTFSKELPNQRKSQEKGSDNKSLFHRANAAE